MTELHQAASEMQTHLDDANKDLLKLMADPGRRDDQFRHLFATALG